MAACLGTAHRVLDIMQPLRLAQVLQTAIEGTADETQHSGKLACVLSSDQLHSSVGRRKWMNPNRESLTQATLGTLWNEHLCTPDASSRGSFRMCNSLTLIFKIKPLLIVDVPEWVVNHTGNI